MKCFAKSHGKKYLLAAMTAGLTLSLCACSGGMLPGSADGDKGAENSGQVGEGAGAQHVEGALALLGRQADLAHVHHGPLGGVELHRQGDQLEEHHHGVHDDGSRGQPRDVQEDAGHE